MRASQDSSCNGLGATKVVAERLRDSLDLIDCVCNGSYDLSVGLGLSSLDECAEGVLSDSAVERAVVGVADGADVVAIVVTRVPAVPRLDGEDGFGLTAFGAQAYRLADLGLTNLVGDVGATLDDLLSSLLCGDLGRLEVCRIATTVVVVLDIPGPE